MKVSYMYNPAGRAMANCCIITDDAGNTWFQSYESTIVHRGPTGKITLGPDWNYSVTTSRQRALFLRESTAETRAKLESGVYDLDSNLGGPK